MQEVTPLEQSPGGTFHVGGNLHPRLAGYLRQEEDTVSIGSDIAAPGSGETVELLFWPFVCIPLCSH